MVLKDGWVPQQILQVLKVLRVILVLKELQVILVLRVM
jgi:hypothetical protein